MPCDGMVKNQQERLAREKALEELAADLEAGRKRINRNLMTGEVSISGWATSSAKATGLCEGCAVRSLQANGWAQKSMKAAKITKKPFIVSSHSGHKH